MNAASVGSLMTGRIRIASVHRAVHRPDDVTICVCPCAFVYVCLDKAAIVEADLSETAEKQPASAAAASTVTEVEEVKMVVKLLPIWSTCILFWTVYSQMTTFSVEQATRMDRHLRPGAASGFAVPAGSLSVFLFLSILLFTSLNERLLVPLAARLTGRPQGLTSLQRVGAGLAFSVAAMVVSALVEKMRRDAATAPGGSVAISAFWLVPQFFLVGAGEAFAYVGQLEFFIREAPERMKSMSTGLFLVTLSMGFFLSSFLVFAVDGVTRGTWIRNNLDRGRLDLFYWMLAVLGVANFAVFLVFASRHQYKPSGMPAAVAPAGGGDSDGSAGAREKEMDDFVAVKEAVEGMDV
ncbi:Protein NRT1/ PTR FAMILY 6.4 [Dichanthelium oligosanthes]|uniref:Protein NRT1/ PTR FAMILY 6.4 n=1 Tax=Dichanthelium oligosanthes TaxID=888268 RepID=A0A1E5W822_9POAL|nr:Protein NRT1/ PTR FAMILY 6.4 [Dichanthelium oligosanthes]